MERIHRVGRNFQDNAYTVDGRNQHRPAQRANVWLSQSTRRCVIKRCAPWTDFGRCGWRVVRRRRCLSTVRDAGAACWPDCVCPTRSACCCKERRHSNLADACLS